MTCTWVEEEDLCKLWEQNTNNTRYFIRSVIWHYFPNLRNEKPDWSVFALTVQICGKPSLPSRATSSFVFMKDDTSVWVYFQLMCDPCGKGLSQYFRNIWLKGLLSNLSHWKGYFEGWWQVGFGYHWAICFGPSWRFPIFHDTLFQVSIGITFFTLRLLMSLFRLMIQN